MSNDDFFDGDDFGEISWSLNQYLFGVPSWAENPAHRPDSVKSHPRGRKPEPKEPPAYEIAMPCEPGGDWIYFVHAPDVHRVKIGYSTDPESRISALRVGCPVPISIVKLIPGTRGDEAKLHFRFRDKRIDGEWFDESVLDDWVSES